MILHTLVSPVSEPKTTTGLKSVTLRVQESFQDRLSAIMTQLNEIEARLNEIHVELFKIGVALLVIGDKLNSLINPGQDCDVSQQAQTFMTELGHVKKIAKSADLEHEEKILTFYVAKGELLALSNEEQKARKKIDEDAFGKLSLVLCEFVMEKQELEDSQKLKEDPAVAAYEAKRDVRSRLAPPEVLQEKAPTKYKEYVPLQEAIAGHENKIKIYTKARDEKVEGMRLHGLPVHVIGQKIAEIDSLNDVLKSEEAAKKEREQERDALSTIVAEDPEFTKIDGILDAFIQAQIDTKVERIKQTIMSEEDITRCIEAYKKELESQQASLLIFPNKREDIQKECKRLQKEIDEYTEELNEAKESNAKAEQKIQQVMGQKDSEKRRLIYDATKAPHKGDHKKAKPNKGDYEFAEHLKETAKGREEQSRLLSFLFCRERIDALFPFIRTSTIYSQLKETKQRTLDAIADVKSENNKSVIEKEAKELFCLMTLGKTNFTGAHDAPSDDLWDCLTFIANKKPSKKIILTAEEQLVNDILKNLEESAPLVFYEYHWDNPHIWNGPQDTPGHGIKACLQRQTLELGKKWAHVMDIRACFLNNRCMHYFEFI